MALRKFILQGRNYISVWATTDITRWDPFTWPIKHAYSDPGHKYEFSLKVARAQERQQAKSQVLKLKKVNSRLLGVTLPQLWDGFI